MPRKKIIESTGLTFSSSNFDPAVYAATAQAARLDSVSLTESKFSSKPSIFWESEQSGKSIKQGYSGLFKGLHFEPEEGFVIGGYQWEAVGKFGAKIAFSMRADYVLRYSGLVGASPEYVQLYFLKIARFTSYPYFRALFATHTSAAELLLGPLPALTERVD